MNPKKGETAVHGSHCPCHCSLPLPVFSRADESRRKKKKKKTIPGGDLEGEKGEGMISGYACNSWLNFRVRGQFEIKILMVGHINTTYFLWIKKKKNWACDHLKTSNLSANNFKKYSTLMGRYLSSRYGQVILVSGYPVLTAVNYSQHWCAIPAFLWSQTS